MKRFYKLAATVDSRLERLAASFVLAILVMLFINGFIGCMGGFPSFLAFLFVFYLLRTVAGDGRRITHRLAMTSRREVGFLLLDYMLGYLLVWGLMRAGFVFSRMTGWGSTKSKTVAEYVTELFAASVLEKWAYFVAAIVMFAFVLSLFPLVVITDMGRLVRYAVLDAAGFSVFCLLFGQFSQWAFETKEKPVSCLIDHLLLCGSLDLLQELLLLAAALALTAGVGVFAYLYAAKEHGPRKGRLSMENAKKKPAKNIAVLLLGLAAVLAVWIFLFLPAESQDGYEKVAQFLTDDLSLAPVEYNGSIYIPVEMELALFETGTAQGYLAEKDEDCTSRFYQLAVADILYADPSGQTDCIQVDGADTGVFAPAERIEAERAWEDKSVFLLWDEDWEQESMYSHEPTGYAACEEDLIEGLRMQTPEVTYQADDFLDYDAYFTIRAYDDLDQAMDEGPLTGEWAGCILVKDDKFYFGSYENTITGICLQQLKEVLGGS